MKKFNYTYVTTNLVNGKKYVGDHSTNNLEDGYIGSGNLFVQKVNEYGKENFSKEILEFFSTKQEAFTAQEKYIKKYKSSVRENGYNISPKGGHNIGGCFSEETLEKLRIGSSKPKSKEHKERIKEGIKKAIKEGRYKRPDWTGREHSNESKQKMSKSHIGKKMSKESKEKNRNKHLRENLSLETKKKMSEGAKKRWEEYRKNKNKN